MSELKDWALNYVENGYCIMPLRLGSKAAAKKGSELGGLHNPCRTAEDVEGLWAEADYGIGLPLGKINNVVGLDVDYDDGCRKDFLKCLPLTYVTLTGSGNHHVFFRYTPLVKNGTVIERGVTLKSDGSYFVMPPTIHDKTGVAYTAERPLWKNETDELPASAIQAPPQLHAVNSRHDEIRRFVCSLTHQGKPYKEVLTRSLRYRDTMPNAEEKTNQEVTNIVNWAFKEIASKMPGGPAVTTLLPLERHTKAVASVDFQTRALVKGVLDHGALSMVYGASNVGKSFIAIDLAYRVSLGSLWFGKRVDKGGAIYVAAEGGGAVRKRLMAFERHHKLTEECPLWLIPSSVDMLNPEADTQRLIDTIRHAAKEQGMPTKLIIIDTLARAIADGNENEGQDMGALLKNLDSVRAATGAGVMMIHHSGKDLARGARGHSSLRAALDTEIEITKGVLSVTKQRDLEFADKINFELKVLELGKDMDGDIVTSCVVVEKTGDGFMDVKPKTDQLLELLHDLMDKEGFIAPAYIGAPEDTFILIRARVLEEGKTLFGGKSGHVNEYLKRFVTEGRIVQKGEFLWFAN